MALFASAGQQEPARAMRPSLDRGERPRCEPATTETSPFPLPPPHRPRSVAHRQRCRPIPYHSPRGRATHAPFPGLVARFLGPGGAIAAAEQSHTHSHGIAGLALAGEEGKKKGRPTTTQGRRRKRERKSEPRRALPCLSCRCSKQGKFNSFVFTEYPRPASQGRVCGRSSRSRLLLAA